MPSILKAIAKAFSKALGPLGAPLEGIISMLEDERTQARQQELLKCIAESKEVSQHIETIIRDLLHGTAASQAIMLYQTVSDALASNRDRLRVVLDLCKRGAGEDELAASLLPLFNPGDIQLLIAAGILSNDMVIKALTTEFRGNVNNFRMLVERNGFPIGMLNEKVLPKEAYSTFIEVFQSGACADSMRTQVSGAILNEFPNDPIIRRWAELYR